MADAALAHSWVCTRHAVLDVLTSPRQIHQAALHTSKSLYLMLVRLCVYPA